MRLRSLVLIASFALAPRVAVATDFYVSPTGDDRNTGTSASAAWRSFTNVNARNFAAGDRVLLQGGQSFTGGITFDAMDRGTPGAPSPSPPTDQDAPRCVRRATASTPTTSRASPSRTS